MKRQYTGDLLGLPYAMTVYGSLLRSVRDKWRARAQPWRLAIPESLFIQVGAG
jgi:hypothetical protein